MKTIEYISGTSRDAEEAGFKYDIVLTPSGVVHEASAEAGGKDESLICFYLNADDKIFQKASITGGSLDEVLNSPGKIFDTAADLSADGILLLCSHPDGAALAGRRAEAARQIFETGRMLGINVLDLIIAGKNKTFSFRSGIEPPGCGKTHSVSEGSQGFLFDLLEKSEKIPGINAERIIETYFHAPQIRNNFFQLHSRRYIGNKYKLIKWLFSIIENECRGDSFADIFAGTGVVAAVASRHFGKIILNDFLYSNYAVYKAFFGTEEYNHRKITKIIENYNSINAGKLAENYFSLNFGKKYFSQNAAKVIGFIRDDIETNRTDLTEREYYILIASLLYSADKIANTVGHYDAYFKKDCLRDVFSLRQIDPVKSVKDVEIFREDANRLAGRIKADVVYIDPPYNSRQYSRFYHVLETLTKWDKPVLYGTALKPAPENMSDYCRISAGRRFSELVGTISAKYLVVSYNNTYAAKSSSSQNKITLEEISSILSRLGKTKIFEKDYRHFNAGNTDFKNHKEYLFLTRPGSL